MYQDQADVVWLLPLFFAGIMSLVAAQQWWRVAHGKEVFGTRIKPSDGDRHFAATASAFAFGLLGVSILAMMWVRG